MFRTIRIFAVGVFVGICATPILAQTAGMTGPPAWQDGSSAYLVSQGPASSSAGYSHAATAPEYSPAVQGNAAELPAAATNVVDQNVLPVAHTVAVPLDSAQSDRYLAPPSVAALGFSAQPSSDAQGRHDASPAGNMGVPASALYTVVSALAIVIGAFLLFAWMLRRGTAGAGTTLPSDVVCVLGRVPLAARQFAQLLRVGNKLVLVSLSAGGVETITEVTDPTEVDRLAGLCQQSNPHSTTKAFEQVFQQLAHERTPSGFFGNDPLPAALTPPPDVTLFRTPRGEAARA